MAIFLSILIFAYLLWFNGIVLKGYFLSYDTYMFQDFIEILILSAIQGISEFLPISSSAHLIIVSNLYNLKSSSLLIDVSLHLGSLLAIIFYFRKDLFDLRKNQKLLTLIIIGSIPLIIFGYLLYSTDLIQIMHYIMI